MAKHSNKAGRIAMAVVFESKHCLFPAFVWILQLELCPDSSSQ